MGVPELGIEGLTAVDLIGRGGFGAVYRVRDDVHGRELAVKVLPPLPDDSARRQFDRERRAMGVLSDHAGIGTVHTSGFTANGEPYIAMQLIDGGSLAERIAQGPLSVRDTLDIGTAMADAVVVAHGAGVLHLDIKPENILFTSRGEPKLVDFGIAKLADDNRATSTIRATPAYAAPEILEGQTATELADVYSLGVTLYAALVGEAPYAGDSMLTVLRRIAVEPVPAITRPDVPAGVVDLLRRAMDKSPAARPPSMARFGEELRALSAGLDSGQTGSVGGQPPASSTITFAGSPIASASIPPPGSPPPAGTSWPNPSGPVPPLTPSGPVPPPGGAGLGGRPPDSPPPGGVPYEPPKKRPMGLIIGGIAAALVAIVVAIVLLTGGDGDDPQEADDTTTTTPSESTVPDSSAATTTVAATVAPPVTPATTVPPPTTPPSTTVPPSTTAPPTTAPPTTVPGAPEPFVTDVEWGTELDASNRAVPTGAYFPDGTTQICVSWTAIDFTVDDPWAIAWSIDGTDQPDLGAAGTLFTDREPFYACVFNDAGLAAGLYELEWTVGELAGFNDSVYVAGGRQPVSITMVNDTGASMCRLQVSPTAAEFWGRDVLGASIISAGDSVSPTMAAGEYDIRVTNCDGDVVTIELAVDFQSDRQFVLTANQ